MDQVIKTDGDVYILSNEIYKSSEKIGRLRFAILKFLKGKYSTYYGKEKMFWEMD